MQLAGRRGALFSLTCCRGMAWPARVAVVEWPVASLKCKIYNFFLPDSAEKISEPFKN